MKERIRSILLEFKERDLPDPLPRALTPPQLGANIRKAWVLMGMRRSGKTWSAYQEIRRRERLGLPRETNLYINFEDDRLNGFTLEDFQSILDIYYELYPQYIQNSKDLFFCFDEIQVVEGWEKFIRRLIDTESMQICVTGSSASMLSRELGTTLGGRAWPQEVFPYSFPEFLHYKNVDPSNKSAKNTSLIKSLSREYLIYGGFPEVVSNPKELHTSLIQEYMDAVVLRDIVKRHSISNAVVVQKFLLRILRQLAAPLSISKVYQSLKSQGISIGKNSLYEYLQYLEDSYALLSVPFFSLSEAVRQTNPKKVYAVDPGVITAYTVKRDYERASRLENAVFMHLRRSFKNICYYKTEKGKEVDFVVTTPKGELLLVQACAEMDNEPTREREISALYDTCRALDLKEGWIISEDMKETLKKDSITIHCLPFSEWALLDHRQ